VTAAYDGHFRKQYFNRRDDCLMTATMECRNT